MYIDTWAFLIICHMYSYIFLSTPWCIHMYSFVCIIYMYICVNVIIFICIFLFLFMFFLFTCTLIVFIFTCIDKKCEKTKSQHATRVAIPQALSLRCEDWQSALHFWKEYNSMAKKEKGQPAWHEERLAAPGAWSACHHCHWQSVPGLPCLWCDCVWDLWFKIKQSWTHGESEVSN